MSVFAQSYQQKPPDKTRILFLLDGSGSMLGKISPTQLKIDAAKQIMYELMDSLKTYDQLQVALRIYGHQYDKRYQNCTDTKLEVPFGVNNYEQIKYALANVQPQGTTPLAYSLSQAANDFPEDPSYRNVIIIITDGIESCDGDPCEVSLNLQKAGVALKPFVVGLGLGVKYKQEFACLGEFIAAENPSRLRETLFDVVETTLAETTFSIELFNPKKDPIKDMAVTIDNAVTKSSVIDIINYLDVQGRPDSLLIDPVLSYEMTVFSVPPITYEMDIQPGRHNAIKKTLNIGKVVINMRGASEYGGNLFVDVYDARAGVYVDRFLLNEEIILRKGMYDIHVNTLPHSTFRNIKVSSRLNANLTIDGPGVLNVYLPRGGTTVIIQEKISEKDVLIKNIDPQQNIFSHAIQPGNYKILYRSENAPGSKFTIVKKFEISSGKTQTIRLNQ